MSPGELTDQNVTAAQLGPGLHVAERIPNQERAAEIDVREIAFGTPE